mgnify:CR=1 FL=1
MVDLDKEEYVYLLIVRTHSSNSHAMEYNVHPFKTADDVKRAMLNIVSNNARSYKSSIKYISYDGTSVVNTNIVASARIEFTSGVTKTYEAVRRCIEEVK